VLKTRGCTVQADLRLAPGRPWRAIFFPDLPTAETGFAGAEQARAWLRTERANVRTALDLAADRGEDEQVVRWCVLLWSFYEKEKLVGDLLVTHAAGLAAAERLGRPDLRALLLVTPYKQAVAGSIPAAPTDSTSDAEKSLPSAVPVNSSGPVRLCLIGWRVPAGPLGWWRWFRAGAVGR
jgi:hypothetical protein